MNIASRTPEGEPNSCPVCGADVKIDPSFPSDDAPCPRCGHLLWFTWEDRGDVQVIKLTGDTLTEKPIDQLIDSLNLGRGQALVLDFSEVQYMSSRALGKLINLKKKVGPARRKMRLRNVHPDLREVFRVCRLDQVLDIED